MDESRWRGAIILATLAMGGCANPATEQALHAKKAMIGMAKADLLSCAGVPVRQMTVGSHDFFTYFSRKIFSYSSWSGYWGWPMYAADISVIDCEATFTLRDGLVDRIVYGGRSGGSAQLGQCYTIVRNCLEAETQQLHATGD